MVRIEFEPRDVWIGLFWCKKRVHVAGFKMREDLHLYLCLIPCFPIHIVIPRREWKYEVLTFSDD